MSESGKRLSIFWTIGAARAIRGHGRRGGARRWSTRRDGLAASVGAPVPLLAAAACGGVIGDR